MVIPGPLAKSEYCETGTGLNVSLFGNSRDTETRERDQCLVIWDNIEAAPVFCDTIRESPISRTGLITEISITTKVS